jgi:hypothetical protein
MKQESQEEKIAEAYQRGQRDGRAAAIAEYDARVTELASRGEKQLTDERSRWNTEQAEPIAAGLSRGFQELESRLAGSIARLLEPLVGRMIMRQAVDAFVGELAALVSDPANPPLQIRGPGDLLALVRRKAIEGPVQVRYVPDDSCEVRVACDQTVVETHLRGWSERLKAALQ